MFNRTQSTCWTPLNHRNFLRLKKKNPDNIGGITWSRIAFQLVLSCQSIFSIFQVLPESTKAKLAKLSTAWFVDIPKLQNCEKMNQANPWRSYFLIPKWFWKIPFHLQLKHWVFHPSETLRAAGLPGLQMLVSFLPTMLLPTDNHLPESHLWL